jgi:hypothetical protein
MDEVRRPGEGTSFENRSFKENLRMTPGGKITGGRVSAIKFPIFIQTF